MDAVTLNLVEREENDEVPIRCVLHGGVGFVCVAFSVDRGPGTS